MYKINADATDIAQIESVSLTQEDLAERYNLQEWIAKHPECLSCGDLLIIQKEFCAWDSQSRKRLDLLALDKDGNLVVIENKRDDSPYDVLAQAITYASFCSTMAPRRIVDEYARYIGKDASEAEEDLCQFVGSESIEDANLNQLQRIIVVAGSFPIEITSAVLWLRDSNVNIECVRYCLYKDGTSRYVDFDRIIPVAESEDYQIRLEERRGAAATAVSESHRCRAEYREYWNMVNNYICAHSELMGVGISPSEAWARRGEQWFTIRMPGKWFSFNLRLYVRGEVGICVSVDVSNESCAGYYSLMREDENVRRIEAAFGGHVVWGDGDKEKTVSTKNRWNRADPNESIRWQMDTLLRVKSVLESLG